MRAMALDVRELGAHADRVDRRLDRIEQTQGAHGEVLEGHTETLRDHGEMLRLILQRLPGPPGR
jgi:hypothetical protein